MRLFVGIGEVLYAVFENGAETLGWAPLNFAIHSHQLASRLGVGRGAIVSCINCDPRGCKILDSLHSLGISTRYIGTDSRHLTGAVSAFMKDGEPGYQIEAGAAWEFIKEEPAFKDIWQVNARPFALAAWPSDLRYPATQSGISCKMLRRPSASTMSI
jgi:sugar/nucleoside kinase (ribokinase family)